RHGRLEIEFLHLVTRNEHRLVGREQPSTATSGSLAPFLLTNELGLKVQHAAPCAIAFVKCVANRGTKQRAFLQPANHLTADLTEPRVFEYQGQREVRRFTTAGGSLPEPR